MGFKEVWRVFFPKKEKKKLPAGVLGCYDSRQFDSLQYDLDYAGEKLVYVLNADNGDNLLQVFTRNYKDTTFINILVTNDYPDFNIEDYHYENYKNFLIERGFEVKEKSCVLVIFQHNTEENIKACKKFCKSDKHHFEQGITFNAKEVEMDFYKPVPDFYRLYNMWVENLYYDCHFIDPTRN